MEAIWSIDNNTTRAVSVAVVPGDASLYGFTNQGAWNAATAYDVNDVVTYLGASYRRKVAGTTAGDPVADTANWETILSGPAAVDWGDGTTEVVAWDSGQVRWEATHTYAADGFYRAVVSLEGVRLRHSFTVGADPIPYVYEPEVNPDHTAVWRKDAQDAAEWSHNPRRYIGTGGEQGLRR